MRDKEAWLLRPLVAGVLAVVAEIATSPRAAPVADRRLCRVRARPPARVGLGRAIPTLLCLVTVGAASDGHRHHLDQEMRRLSRWGRPASPPCPGRRPWAISLTWPRW